MDNQNFLNFPFSHSEHTFSGPATPAPISQGQAHGTLPIGTPVTQTRRRRRSDKEKLEDILSYIKKDVRWSLGEFLWHLFSTEGEAAESNSRTQAVSRFLTGQSEHKPIEIIKLVYNSSYSYPKSGHLERDEMFSVITPSSDILHARPAMSTWALEEVMKHTRKESNTLVSREAGLRVRATSKSITDETAYSSDVNADDWEDIDSDDDVPLIEQLGASSRDSRHSSSHAQSGSGSGDLLPVRNAGVPGGDEAEAGEDRILEDFSLNNTTGSEEVLEEVNHSEREVRRGPRSVDLSRKKRHRRQHDPVVSWDAINGFSLTQLEKKFISYAPVCWHILMGFMQSGGEERNDGEKHRPKRIVCSSVLSELVYARNQWVNLFPLCRGISLFSMKAHQSVYRVGSRLAQCPPYTTVRNSLVTMAYKKRQSLRATNLNPRWLVLDNLQAYARRRDQRIGNANKMITGTGATVIEMEDCTPGAFDVDELDKKMKDLGRRELSVEAILEDIDWAHLESVSSLHFTDILVQFVPTLAVYRKQMPKCFKEVAKHQINPTRRSKVQPLGTNSANEVSTQGMNEALADFFEQMGLTNETYSERLQFVSGDGKSFEAIGKLKKYLSSQDGNFESLGFVIEVLEIWHTKWHDLSRICASQWGPSGSNDPSTLSYLAKALNSPIPSDLKKVDFYPNARLIDVAVRAHILQCWEVYYGTKDLVKYFSNQESQGSLPTLSDIRDVATILTQKYATSQAYERALEDPVALAWGTSSAVPMSGTPLPNNQPANDSELFRGDWALANSILLIRDGLLFLEACSAVASGDTGRVWEVMKVWIFSFAGAGNSNYTTYLLEMFCKIRYELPDATREALFSNWLVNLKGVAGHFLPMDLMQEHFNYWLEELAQHKGKEFDDEWYREVLSMHVHHFLRLKEEMENVVEIKPHTKRHSEPHLDNELREAMRIFREFDLHRHHRNRDLGFHTTDSRTKGVVVLRDGKISNFVQNSIFHRENWDSIIKPDFDHMAEAETYKCQPIYYENGNLCIPLPTAVTTDS